MKIHLNPSCPQGMTEQDILELFPLKQKREDFYYWMRGQTGSICDGRSYNHEVGQYEPTVCANSPHGLIIYTWDVERYLQGLPVIDLRTSHGNAHR